MPKGIPFPRQCMILVEERYQTMKLQMSHPNLSSRSKLKTTLSKRKKRKLMLRFPKWRQPYERKILFLGGTEDGGMLAMLGTPCLSRVRHLSQ